MSPYHWTGKVWLLIFLLVASGMPSTITGADQTPEILVVTEHWFPFNYLDEQDQIAGSSTQIVKAALGQANIRYKIRVYPWARAYQLASSKANVVIYSIMRTAMREDKFQWICPIQPSIPQFVYKLSSRTDISAQSLQDIRGFSLGLSRGSYTYELIKAEGLIEGKDFSAVSDTSHFFYLLLKGRVDLFVDTAEGMLQKLAEAGLNRNHTTPLFQLYSADICMATSLTTDKHIVDKLRQALNSVNARRHQDAG